MKTIDTSIIKDIIISILIVICIILILIIILYNKTGLTKFVPEVEEYQMSEEMAEHLGETAEQEENTVVTYKIDSTDLKSAEITKEYDKGKKNPFAMESSDFISNSYVVNSGVSENEYYYEDDGTK